MTRSRKLYEFPSLDKLRTAVEGGSETPQMLSLFKDWDVRKNYESFKNVTEMAMYMFENATQYNNGQRDPRMGYKTCKHHEGNA